MSQDNQRQVRSPAMALFHKHFAVAIAVIASIVVFVLLTSGRFNAGNFLASWNVGAAVYIVLTWYRMLTADVRRIRRRSADLDFSDSLVLALSILAALASIAGIALELTGVKDAAPGAAAAQAGVAFLTILISWVFLHTLFTTHYAHRFYADPGAKPAIIFPEHIDEPIYWDFLYFSFIIGVAAQTADVAIATMPMRRLALLHSVLSFLFNTTILALAINVGASLL
ncbi:DUF1345 domain-containing protein [Rhizobium sp. BK376]|uniref:DUF1345 domain-containing protein n=1 Tax=Rhizobium sp. BK376 TaxID=2512149 RepID=UPI001043B0FA|nr:DUF1345 domain-containing protein [Rhizobium sp. BK376]TCR81587.1 putative membrane protein [Rhizobium sp. BK376]